MSKNEALSEEAAINYVERWEQALRVLENMTEHERKKRFDMGSWGEKTECGTVACLAGHCSLDPWFIERGFTSEFKKSVIDDTAYLRFTDVDPDDFFGNRGEAYIFQVIYMSYAEVVEAVEDHIAYLKDGGDANEFDDNDDEDDDFDE